MGVRVKSGEKIVQRSVGFHLRQILFIEKYPDFKPDKFLRIEMDNQISQVDPTFLSETDTRRQND